jgi:hypothetical protein
MGFPRIKEFEFDINRTFTVPVHLVGRLHRIAYELYGDVSYYKPLAAANNIRINMGVRAGIRPIKEALTIELKQEGHSDDDIKKIIADKFRVKRINYLDWTGYEDITYGYISEVTEGRLLVVPRDENAKLYLSQFEFIESS